MLLGNDLGLPSVNEYFGGTRGDVVEEEDGDEDDEDDDAGGEFILACVSVSMKQLEVNEENGRKFNGW
jgi:hypothetical protein